MKTTNKKLTRKLKEQKVLNGLKRMIREQKLREVESVDGYTFDDLTKLVNQIIQADNARGYENMPSANRAIRNGESAEKILQKIGFLDKDGSVIYPLKNPILKRLDRYMEQKWGL